MARSNVYFGGADIEVATDVATGDWTDMGHLNSVSFTESWEQNSVQSHNKGVFKTTVSNHQVQVTADSLEISPTLWNKIRGTLDTYTTTAATPLTGETKDVLTWSYATFIPLGVDGSAFTITDVTQDPSGTPVSLVENTDFIVMNDDEGRTGIMVLDTVDTDTAMALQITYDYTPYATEKLTSGSAIEIPARAIRITQETAGERTIKVTIPFAKVQEGITLNFGDVNNPNEPISWNFNMIADVDSATDTLFTAEFVDES